MTEISDLQKLSFPEKEIDLSGADFGFLNLHYNSQTLPTWWSPARDKVLREQVRQSDHLSGATYSMVSKMTAIPPTIRARNPHIKLHVKQAERYERTLLETSDLYRGWINSYAKFMLDYFTQDNGAFFAIVAPGRKDREPSEEPQGVYQLDASRCQRTGDAEFPIVYQHDDGIFYKLHWRRVIEVSSMTSAEKSMNGVGFSAVSRAYDSAQALIDIARYKQEKLGSRPLRAFLTITGMSFEDAIEMIEQAKIKMDTQGLTRFAKIIMLANIDPIKVELTDLAKLPDGFDEKETTTLAMNTIALAFGVDARELWPATASGATKADATVQHQKARGKAPGQIMRKIEREFNVKYLPPHLEFKFDFTDDSFDESRAEIHKKLSEALKYGVDSGIISTRVARERLFEDGAINKVQFELEELNEGRLPEGEPVRALFSSTDPQIVDMLKLNGVSEPLNVKGNNSEKVLDAIDQSMFRIESVMINTFNPETKSKARQSYAALQYLQTLYQQPTEVLPPQQPEQGIEQPKVNDNQVQQQTPNNQQPQAIKSRKLMIRKDAGTYRAGLESIAMNFYWGNISDTEFSLGMQALINQHFSSAYFEGMDDCDRLTLDETDNYILSNLINEEYDYVDSFATAILSSESPERVMNRVDLWTNGYTKVKSFAQMNACPDDNMIWQYDPTKEHCSDCAHYDGQVRKGIDWMKLGVHPRGKNLECGGWRCGCGLYRTSLPVTNKDIENPIRKHTHNA